MQSTVLLSFLIGTVAAYAQSCGQTPIQPNLEGGRIVNGETARSGSWPWQVEMLANVQGQLRQVCGGSLVSNRRIVTAAHCVVPPNSGGPTQPNDIRIRLGGFDKLSDEVGKFQYEVASITVHPQYNGQQLSNDIALIDLSEEVEFTDRIQPVCLPETDGDSFFMNNNCYVTGWGKTEGGQQGQDARYLQQVQLPFISFSFCQRFFRIDGRSQVCAGTPDRSGCQGDSGGPLVVQHEDGRWHLHGVVSFGSQECRGAPGVFTRVTNFRSFIGV